VNTCPTQLILFFIRKKKKFQLHLVLQKDVPSFLLAATVPTKHYQNSNWNLHQFSEALKAGSPAGRNQSGAVSLTLKANRHLRIIFSAKESIFKCFFPISQTYLSFQDAAIILDEKKFEFSFVLSKACSGITSAGFQHSGKFSIKDDLLLTSVYI
jgi:phosphopantetheinyl transferase (holo-ACP synthase)